MSRLPAGLSRPATTGRGSLPGRGGRLGLFQLLEQRGQHPYLLGLPVGHEGGKPVQAYFGQRLQLIGTGGGERHAAGALVGRVGRDLHQPQALKLADLAGDLRGMDILRAGDRRGADSRGRGDDLKEAEGARPFFWRLARSSAAFVTKSALTIARTSSRLAFTRSCYVS